MTARILVIEDNADLALGLRRSLELDGYEVEVTVDGRAGLERIRSRSPDLLVLDLMLPRLSGYRVLHALRQEGYEFPVLILSAKGEEIHKVEGFRLGADNYAVKPIGVLELSARVEALLQRHGSRAGTHLKERYAFGDITVDVPTRSVHRAGSPVELSPKEFDLLLHLLRRDGAVVGRNDLLRDVWGYKRPVPTRTVDAHVALLRSKLEDDASRPRYLLTIRKAGYRLDPGRASARPE